MLCASCNEKGIQTQPQNRWKFSTQQYLSDSTSNAPSRETDTSSLINGRPGHVDFSPGVSISKCPGKSFSNHILNQEKHVTSWANKMCELLV